MDHGGRLPHRLGCGTTARSRMKHLAAVLLLLATNVFAADEATVFNTREELAEFMQGYYKNPRPELVESAMRFVAGAGAELMTGDNTARMMQTSFTCLFQRHPERRDGWKKVIASLPEPGQNYFHVSMESDVNAMFHDTPTLPVKNDMSWGCYFVTGDASYAQDVILAMKNLDERKDLNKFLTAASAQWSLAGLASKDDKIHAALEAAAKGNDKQLAAAAKAALTTPVADLRAGMIQTLREQKKAGVW